MMTMMNMVMLLPLFAIGIDMRERERWAMVAMMKNHGDGW